MKKGRKNPLVFFGNDLKTQGFYDTMILHLIAPLRLVCGGCRSVLLAQDRAVFLLEVVCKNENDYYANDYCDRKAEY